MVPLTFSQQLSTVSTNIPFDSLQNDQLHSKAATAPFQNIIYKTHSIATSESTAVSSQEPYSLQITIFTR